jgi:multidrug efflux pump subunit AcrA (membrane-fusion protein)
MTLDRSKVMMSKKKMSIGRIRAMCLILLVVLAACKEKAPPPPPPPAVAVAQPIQRIVTDYLELTGNTQAIQTVQLVARVSGYLEKVLFQDGQIVKKGQLLFLIQQNTY